MKLRLNLLFFMTLGGFLIILGRFFYWQIVAAEHVIETVGIAHVRKSVDTAYRGSILAADATTLVGQANVWNVFAEPKFIERESGVARQLALILVEDEHDTITIAQESARIEELLKSGRPWVPIKNRIDTTTKEKIESKGLKGIGFDSDEIRVYPEASTSAHLLGFLGKNGQGENQGYFGLEGFYNDTLSSSYGIQKSEADVRGLPILFGKKKKIPTYSGADLVTYIDKGIQSVVEEELAKGLEKYGASEGSVVVMNPNNGGILAMSSFPGFDPGKYWEYSNDVFLNPVISKSFEPGSVFKVIVMASALDLGVVEPDTECDKCSGPVTIGQYSIHTWNDKYYPGTTMTDVIVHSDNTGMVFAAGKIGREKMIGYLEKFGIGQKTGIDLQGEMTPKLRNSSDWGEIDLATSSFGQGIAVTPIQLISAVNAIANDGIFVKPGVVKEFVIDGVIYPSEASVKDQRMILSEESALKMTLMMVEAAKNGESKWTYKKGFGVAGKTGTAQIPIAGHYDEEKTIASFIGFAPYKDPKFTMLVTLREPQSSPWASETAAPLWYDIAEKLFLHFGMIPEK